jgi:Barstar (barnase inhibitor)
MRVVELHADTWDAAMDFVAALKVATGAPDWHGSSPDAFMDSMIYRDEINALKAPYTIKIMGADNAGAEAQEAICLYAQVLNDAGASDRGTDLEVTIVIESSN